MKSEYRVVGDPKLGNTPEIIKTQCEFGEAEHYRDLYRGDSAFTNVRIQSRLVPPWIDLHTPPEEREGQVTVTDEMVTRALKKGVGGDLADLSPDFIEEFLRPAVKGVLEDILGIGPAAPNCITQEITITVSLEGAKSFVSASSGWGAIGMQEVTEGIEAALLAAGHEPPYEPSDQEDQR